MGTTVSHVLLKSLPCAAVCRNRSNLWLVALLVVATVWAVPPALAHAYHGTGGDVRVCDAAQDWESRCECRYHVAEIIDDQLMRASSDPNSPYPNRFVILTGTFGYRPSN